MCVCGEFPWKLENNQLSDCSIIFFFMSDGNFDELLEDLYPIIGT